MSAVEIKIASLCPKDGGPGGFFAVMYSTELNEICRCYRKTNWVRTELMGLIAALEGIHPKSTVHILSNSDFTVSTINGKKWKTWEKNDWRKTQVGYTSILQEYDGLPYVRQGEPIKHSDLWKQIARLTSGMKISAEKAYGRGDYRLVDLFKMLEESLDMGDFSVDSSYERTLSKTA